MNHCSDPAIEWRSRSLIVGSPSFETENAVLRSVIAERRPALHSRSAGELSSVIERARDVSDMRSRFGDAQRKFVVGRGYLANPSNRQAAQPDFFDRSKLPNIHGLLQQQLREPRLREVPKSAPSLIYLVLIGIGQVCARVTQK